MQYLPSSANQGISLSSQSIFDTRTTFTQTYATIQELQTGKSFDEYLDELDEKNDRKDDEERRRNAQTVYTESQGLFADTSTKEKSVSRDLQKAQNNVNSLMEDIANNAYELNEKEYSSLSNKFLSPYSMQANIADEDVRLNSDEVDKLIKNMNESGYTDAKVLSAIQEAGQSVLGVSSGEIIYAAMQAVSGEEVSLTKLEEQQLLNLSQKLENSSTSAEDLFTRFTSNSPQSILNAVTQSIEEQGSITFSRAELEALTTSLNLEKAAEEQINELIAQANFITLDKTNFDKLFASAIQEIAEEQKSMELLEEQLAAQLPEMEKTARQRLESEANAQRTEEQYKENSRLLTQNTLTKDILTDLRTTTIENEEIADLVKMQYIQEQASTKPINDKPSMADSLRNAVEIRNEFTNTLQISTQFAETESDTEGDSLLDQDNNFNNLFNLFNTQAQGLSKPAENISTAKSEFLPMYRQLESSLYTAVKNNVTKLEVELNPVELGALSVTITSKDGELSALIQPEKLETMHMINQQIATLKRELESQGVKLENIEVELKSDDKTGSESDNFAEHREQDTYEMMTQEIDDLNRLRVLGRGINDGLIDENVLTEEELALAQKLLEDDKMEMYYSELDSYLNIVA